MRRLRRRARLLGGGGVDELLRRRGHGGAARGATTGCGARGGYAARRCRGCGRRGRAVPGRRRRGWRRGRAPRSARSTTTVASSPSASRSRSRVDGVGTLLPAARLAPRHDRGASRRRIEVVAAASAAPTRVRRGPGGAGSPRPTARSAVAPSSVGARAASAVDSRSPSHRRRARRAGTADAESSLVGDDPSRVAPDQAHLGVAEQEPVAGFGLDARRRLDLGAEHRREQHAVRRVRDR